jgi:hypothetical protein
VYVHVCTVCTYNVRIVLDRRRVVAVSLTAASLTCTAGSALHKNLYLFPHVLLQLYSTHNTHTARKQLLHLLFNIHFLLYTPPQLPLPNARCTACLLGLSRTDCSTPVSQRASSQILQQLVHHCQLLHNILRYVVAIISVPLDDNSSSCWWW